MKYLDDLLLYAIKTDLSAPIQPKKNLDPEKPWWETWDDAWVGSSDTPTKEPEFLIYTDREGKDIFDKAMEANVKNSTEE